MSIIELVLVAVGLSMDAFAVAVGKGLGMRRREHLQALTLAAAFGFFQGLMPLVGWLVGSRFAALISDFDHWIAFGLLGVVGVRMILEAVRDDDEPVPASSGLGLKEVLMLSIATSIDALAAGVGFAFMRLDIWTTVGLIAAITGALSFVGVVVGHQFGSRFERPAAVAGGLILIGIGAKILLQHLGVVPF